MVIVAFTGHVAWFSAIAVSHVTAVKISVLCIISAFERSLWYYTGKPCCGRWQRNRTMPLLNHRNVVLQLAASRGLPCDCAASCYLHDVSC